MYSLHKIPVSILFIFLFSSASAGDPYGFKPGAAEAGTGYSCITSSGFWAAFHNQALLPFNKSFSAGLDYQNRFGIPELGTTSAAIIYKAGKAGLGVMYSHFGCKDFARHSGGLACGLKLSEKISAGVQTDIFLEKTPGEYDERNALTFEAGILIKASEKVNAGIHIFNPVPNSLRKNYLPSSISAGAGIRLNNAIYASAEAEMSTGKDLALMTGFEYNPGKNFRVRGGYKSENNSFSFGIGYMLREVSIDFAFSTHDRLGISSSVSLIYTINE